MRWRKEQEGSAFTLNCGNSFHSHTHTHTNMYRLHMHTYMHGYTNRHTHTQVASLDWSCRELICTTLKCISIKEKHIVVPGEERRERCERMGGRNGVWNSVWEYESNRRCVCVGGGVSSTVFGKRRREGDRGRESVFSFPSLGKTSHFGMNRI